MLTRLIVVVISQYTQISLMMLYTEMLYVNYMFYIHTYTSIKPQKIIKSKKKKKQWRKTKIYCCFKCDFLALKEQMNIWEF